MPKVSIITPCYNSARFVGRTIESVRAQTLMDWEHIVVDDGSTDDSADVVAAYSAEEPRLRLVRQANGGVSRARNAGFAASSPDSAFLLFLDADDCLEPEMLAVMVGYLEAHREVGLAYCDPLFMDEQGDLLRVRREEIGWAPRLVPAGLWVRELPSTHAETPLVSMFGLTTIIPSISVLRRAVFERTPRFDESFGHIHEDMDLFLQMALLRPVHHVPQPLLRYRRHGAQSTSDPARMYAQEQKLWQKWRQMADLSPEQCERVDAAFHFREYRLTAFCGLKAMGRHLRRGEITKAARFLGGALRRYPKSLLPAPPGRRQSAERSYE